MAPHSCPELHNSRKGSVGGARCRVFSRASSRLAASLPVHKSSLTRSDRDVHSSYLFYTTRHPQSPHPAPLAHAHTHARTNTHTHTHAHTHTHTHARTRTHTHTHTHARTHAHRHARTHTHTHTHTHTRTLLLTTTPLALTRGGHPCAGREGGT